MAKQNLLSQVLGAGVAIALFVVLCSFSTPVPKEWQDPQTVKWEDRVQDPMPPEMAVWIAEQEQQTR